MEGAMINQDVQQEPSSRPDVGPPLDHDREFCAPIEDADALKQFFEREGYAVIRNAVPKEICEQAKQAFNCDVKTHTGFFRRHATGSLERHVFTEAGFMKYPIMNIQDLLAPRFSRFRHGGLAILSHPNIQNIMTTLLGGKGKIIHTMYFDGNQQTWAHRDSHYIDSEEIGRMIGVWVAAEDIHPGAGRFFVHARSHLAVTPPEWQLDDIDPNGTLYKKKIVELVRDGHSSEFGRVAPILKQGDAIVWSSLTIHGSLETTATDRSRRSFTAHYIPEHHHFLSLRRFKGTERGVTRVNGVEIIQHEDQNRLLSQIKGLGDHVVRNRFPRLHKAYLGYKKWRLEKKTN
jgi:phytanoyl-CoA hydroxylase